MHRMSQMKGGDNMSLEEALKIRLNDERICAEKRFIELDALYSNALKCDGISRSEEYMQYLKNERDVAYMIMQLKKKNCNEVKKIMKTLK